MLCRPLGRGVLAVLILVRAPTLGQSVREEHTEAAQPVARRSTAPVRAPDLSRAKVQIHYLTNEFRRQEGRPSLPVNSDLADAAQAYAEFMARTDKYGHTADGREP